MVTDEQQPASDAKNAGAEQPCAERPGAENPGAENPGAGNPDAEAAVAAGRQRALLTLLVCAVAGFVLLSWVDGERKALREQLEQPTSVSSVAADPAVAGGAEVPADSADSVARNAPAGTSPGMDGAASSPDVGIEDLSWTSAVLAVLTVVPPVLFSVWLFRLAGRARREQRFPPSGVVAIRNVQELQGEPAVRRAKLLQVVALWPAALALMAGFQAWRVIQSVAAG